MWNVLGEFRKAGSLPSEMITVAIKVLKADINLEAECDFEREIEILSSFNHPNIVRLLGVVREGKNSTATCGSEKCSNIDSRAANFMSGALTLQKL